MTRPLLGLIGVALVMPNSACIVLTTAAVVGGAAVAVGSAAVSVGAAAVGVAADAAVGTVKLIGKAVSSSDSKDGNDDNDAKVLMSANESTNPKDVSNSVQDVHPAQEKPAEPVASGPR